MRWSQGHVALSEIICNPGQNGESDQALSGFTSVKQD